MNRPLAIGLIAGSALLIVALLLWWSLDRDDQAATPPPTETSSVALPPEPDEGLVRVELYFPGKGGRLYREPRDIPAAEDLAERVRILAQAVLTGPETTGLGLPLPSGTTLSGVDIGESGVVYIDLAGEAGQPPPPSGSRQEMLMVYSLVDSVALNLEEVEQVVLLWNGTQPSTFAGHLDTTRPLVPDTSLLASVR